jgi:hypothetical protein
VKLRYQVNLGEAEWVRGLMILAAKDAKRATMEAIQRRVGSRICNEYASEVEPEAVVDAILSEMSL